MKVELGENRAIGCVSALSVTLDHDLRRKGRS